MSDIFETAEFYLRSGDVLKAIEHIEDEIKRRSPEVGSQFESLISMINRTDSDFQRGLTKWEDRHIVYGKAEEMVRKVIREFGGGIGFEKGNNNGPRTENLKKLPFIFISYAFRNIKEKEKVEKVLKKTQGTPIAFRYMWNVIDPGRSWEDSVKFKLMEADLIIVLVSNSFFSQEQCLQELELAYSLHQAEISTLIRIIIDPPMGGASRTSSGIAFPSNGQSLLEIEDKDSVWQEFEAHLREQVSEWA